MNRFRLKLPIPGCAAGTIGYDNGFGEITFKTSLNTLHIFKIRDMELYPDFFHDMDEPEAQENNCAKTDCDCLDHYERLLGEPAKCGYPCLRMGRLTNEAKKAFVGPKVGTKSVLPQPEPTIAELLAILAAIPVMRYENRAAEVIERAHQLLAARLGMSNEPGADYKRRIEDAIDRKF